MWALELLFLGGVLFQGDLAKAHVDECRKYGREVRHSQRKALLSVVLAEHFLEVLERVQFNPFDPALFEERARLSLQWRMTKIALLRRW